MVGAANSINLATAGIVGFTGTAFGATPVTQYNVLLGGASVSTIAQAAPAAAGTVLTSNGVAANPSFQAVASSFAPNSNVQIFDDFLGYIANTPAGFLNWINQNFLDLPAAEAAHPGLIGNQSTSTVDCYYTLKNAGNTAASQFVLGGGIITINWVIKINTLSNATNRYILRLGLGDTVNADQVNGTYFEYSDNVNSGNWVGKTASASTRSTANSTTAVSTGWHNIMVQINAAGTSVAFFVDGVQIANSPLAANIPTAAIVPFIDVIRSAGTIAASSVVIDLMYLNQVLTTAR